LADYWQSLDSDSARALPGDFATDARITTVSGSVTLRLMPKSSVHVDAA
jgi:hypothetical protein